MATINLNAQLPDPKDFPSNSKCSSNIQTSNPKSQKVISGNVVRKKKSFGRKLADVFISEDVEDVKGYILYEVLIPSIKNAFADAIGGGIDMLLGTSTVRRRTSKNDKQTPYGTFYKGNSSSSKNDRHYRSGYSYDDIILETRGEAQDVLDMLVTYIDQYGAVRLSDLQEMVGATGQYTDTYWGWTNLSSAVIRHVREGWLLDLPRIENLR